MEIKYLVSSILLFIISIVVCVYAFRIKEKKIALASMPFIVILATYIFVYIVQPKITLFFFDLVVLKCILAILYSIILIVYAVLRKKVSSLFIGMFGLLLLSGVLWYLYLYL